LDRRTTLKLLAGSFLPTLAYAQQPGPAYPDRPISLVIPFPAGGLADTVARAAQPLLEAELGVTVVPVNRPGASGAIGTAHVANAKADGYTLLFTLSSISVLPEQARVNQRSPAFTLQQLQPIARFGTESLMLVVPADSPYKDARQLIEDARRRPGQLSYASSGNYGTVHLPAEVFAGAANIRLNHIPFAGGAPALQNLLGKQVDFSFLPRSIVLPHMKAGKLRALASMSSQRWPKYPEVPFVQEVGVAMDDYPPWTGLFAPAGIPDGVLQRLRAASAKAVSHPSFRAAIEGAEGQVAYLDAPEFKTYWTSETAKLNEVVRRVGKLD
jgi:tripartite-type tricarboxylate transporter receptor subunit TctC